MPQSREKRMPTIEFGEGTDYGTLESVLAMWMVELHLTNGMVLLGSQRGWSGDWFDFVLADTALPGGKPNQVVRVHADWVVGAESSLAVDVSTPTSIRMLTQNGRR